ncbi:MAG: ROK family protein [Steroidobacteraceae bacterium]
MSSALLGIDVGGSSIKLAAVDGASGRIVGDVASVPLPMPSTPARVLDAARAAAGGPAAGATGAIGLAIPSVVRGGVALTAANVDASWIGTDVAGLLAQRSGRPCVVLNDADAAGLAEMRFGAGRDLGGVVFVLTLGTGIGTAPFVDGRLLPNTELGHLHLAGIDAADGEQYASARVRTQQGLDWPEWVARLNRYLGELQRLFWPDAFILGGAVSEHFDEWGPLVRVAARVLPAQFRGQAGVVGAALAAAERYNA